MRNVPVLRRAPGFALLVVVALATRPAAGYFTSYPSYERMQRESDAVVIATPVARRELEREATLPGVTRGAGLPVPAVALETTFRVAAALQGDLQAGDELRLVHFRERDPDPSGFVSAGPLLVDFTPDDKSLWLMFLERGDDGTWTAFDEIEPGFCIVRLATRMPEAGF